MFIDSILAVSGLISLVAAVPMAHEHHHRKRDYVWVTETEEAVVTIPVTQTIWVEPSETAPAIEHNGRPTYTSYVHQTVTVPSPSPESTYVAPFSSEASSVYVAPTTSSTPVYVAPTTSSTSVYVAPTTSSTSQYIAPAPTTSSSSVYVAPTTEAPAPTSAYVAPTTSSAPPAPSPAASGGSGMSSGMAASGTSYTGDLTWYDVGLGSCGITNVASDHVVAISHVIFDSYPAANPNLNPVCGKTVSITGTDGSSYTATVVDRCVGCAAADLDLSQDFFDQVTNNGDGRVHNMKWTWN